MEISDFLKKNESWASFGTPRQTYFGVMGLFFGPLQPPELKSLIFHLEVFRFWAHLLDASVLVSEKLVEVLN